MGLKSITIENFKGISEPITIEIKPITLLFGSNSAGKSTIIHALHYLREVLEHNNYDTDSSGWAGETLDLGGFESIVNGHDLYKSIKIRVDFKFYFDDLKPYPALASLGMGHNNFSTKDIKKVYNDFIEDSYIEIEISYCNNFKKPFLSRFESGFFGEKISEIIYKSSYYTFNNTDEKYFSIEETLKYVNFKHRLFCCEFNFSGSSFLKDSLNGILPDDFLGGHGKEGLPLVLSGKPPTLWGNGLFIDWEDFLEDQKVDITNDQWIVLLDFQSYLTQLTKGPCDILLNILKDMIYIGPIRKTPSRNFMPKKTTEPSRWSSGLAAWDKLHNINQDFLSKLNLWLSGKERLNSGYSLSIRKFREVDSDNPISQYINGDLSLEKLKEAQHGLISIPEKSELSIIDLKQNCKVHPHDIGIGISQVLPIVICALTENTNFIAIEQPELHIHPNLQCRLADLLINTAIKCSTWDDKIHWYGEKTYFLETHSEHLLLRLLRRIRETTNETLPDWHIGLRPENVSINFICFSEGKYQARKLEVSIDGDSLGKWPDGFFEERAEELF